MLSAEGFDARVRGSASEVSRWLGGYLAHPAGQIGILADGDGEAAGACQQGLAMG
jgi:hypothetical protein